MSEILSQSQIDSLLSSLTSGIKENEQPEPTPGKKGQGIRFQKPEAFYERAAEASVQYL